MSNSNNNRAVEGNIEKLIKGAGSDAGASEQLRRAAGSNPAVARAIGRLTERDIAGITALLGDKEALARIMSAPKAQELIRKLKG